MLYSLVKLRLPEDPLINSLVDRAEFLIFEMSPKDLALTVWALARLRLPSNSELTKKAASAIERYIKTVQEEKYLFEANDVELDKEVNHIAPPDSEEVTSSSSEEMIPEPKNSVETFMSTQTLAMYYWSLGVLFKDK